MKNNFCQKCEYIDNDVRCFVDRYGIDLSIAKLLSARGVNRHSIKRYFKLELKNFYDPFTMVNMDKACDTIKEIMQKGGSILVYGDYDADGLTAASILKLFFYDNGVDCDVIIPSRAEGYGINVDKIALAFDRKHYDLLITVDCGVSNKEEITRILNSLNTKIIVTDHHEIPAELPPCICVNPKLGYRYPNLSGAGVAFKLVQALAGIENSINYADLAALGTVADMMPLIDENRDIVRLGLEHFGHKGLIKLADASGCKKPYTAYDLAMKIAPRINAAGRVGDVNMALQLLSNRAATKQSELVATLVSLNEKRRVLLEELLSEAEQKMPQNTVFHDNLVFIYDDNWNSGILGIAANRFKELYNVPALVMAREGDNYVGSARGIEGIDLHELFVNCSHLLVKFGGHKASVGFTVSQEKLLELKDALAAQLRAIDHSYFNPQFYYDMPFEDMYLTKDFIKNLESMQPVLPSSKPVFHHKGYARTVCLFGQERNHLRLTLDNGLELKGYFKFYPYYHALNTNCECEVLFSLEIDRYTDLPSGVIHQIKINNSIRLDDIYAQNYIRRLDLSLSKHYADREQVEKLLKEKNTLAVFNSYSEFEFYAKKFDFSQYYIDLFVDSSIYSQCVFISPNKDDVFKYYKNIICFGNYKTLSAKFDGKAFMYNDKSRFPAFLTQHVDRDVCMVVFKAIREPLRTNSLYSLYDNCQLHQVSFAQFLLCLKVFEELHLLSIVHDNGLKITFNDKKKVDLTSSKTYNFFNPL